MIGQTISHYRILEKLRRRGMGAGWRARTRRPHDGLVKILDFGIARLAGSARVTHTGKVVGSIDYMSPEHARGEEVDQRTDVWSLGVVLYEALTGERPFRGGNDQAVLYQILNGQPRPLAEQGPDLPSHVEPAIRKAPLNT